MLCHYLTPDSIICPMGDESKDAIYDQLIDRLVKQHDLNCAEKIRKAIATREKMGATLLPVGIAMPHARCSSVSDIHMVMGIVPQGLRQSCDGEECATQIVCLFISPNAETEFTKHLQLLARIASIFHDESVVQGLAAATCPEKAFTLLQRYERAAEERMANAVNG